MGLLRREVLSPLPSWRKPHALAGLFFASLLFATSLDALLLSYRLRCAELEQSVARPSYRRVDAAAELARSQALIEQARRRAADEQAYRSQSGSGHTNCGAYLRE